MPVCPCSQQLTYIRLSEKVPEGWVMLPKPSPYRDYVECTCGIIVFIMLECRSSWHAKLMLMSDN